jgi:SAM-dependent methyltransferase
MLKADKMMRKDRETGVGKFLDAAMHERLYSTRSNLRYHMDRVFGDVDLRGKRVLDIGGGSGLYSFYAAEKGAEKVVCLEPEISGSTSRITERFHRFQQAIGDRKVVLVKESFQSFEAGKEKFDVILLNNSINHLDEKACIALREDPGARDVYRAIFAKLHALSNEGATLVVRDCSSSNFFAAVGMRNPFAPTIEWPKHQPPEVWAELLKEAGFTAPRITWSSFNRLGTGGRLLFGHRWTSYFLISHFCLKMSKPREIAGPLSSGGSKLERAGISETRPADS